MKKLSTMLLAGVLALGPLGIGCSVSDDDDTASGDLSADEAAQTFEDGDSPLDPAQKALYDALADQLGSQAAAVPGGDRFIEELTYALLFLMEGPDEVLAALQSGDTAALGLAGTSFAENTTKFVDKLLCAINSLASEDCESLSAGGVPGDFTNLETYLILLQGELAEGDGADLSFASDTLEDITHELELILADNSGELPGDPYASSLIQLLEELSGDSAVLLDIIGDEDGEGASEELGVLLTNLLENLFIGLPQLAEENPQLSDQVKNELSIAVNAINSFTIDFLPLILNNLSDPLTDALGPLLDGLLEGLSDGI